MKKDVNDIDVCQNFSGIKPFYPFLIYYSISIVDLIDIFAVAFHMHNVIDKVINLSKHSLSNVSFSINMHYRIRTANLFRELNSPLYTVAQNKPDTIKIAIIS